ncbi:DNA-binding transcriptional regulator, FadR family [Haloechinothrix alba]|uniref:DNA-binding transcriptional regulator, FadR family n=1 Tax=Haloechinothrix alba TaxID=664784 RepID=A0A238ZEV2_9PSEU|nr:GntR family transcriptional regulator [Haloechinothrix alba]SNR81810.1 DNA-binding transcriptional regulator, FadR family [Haloechinothrix alba]
MAHPPTNTALTRETLVDAVERNLRQEILAGTYTSGQYLPPTRELAERYEVTRTTLKHALMRLSQAGLVETKHGVGTRVRDYERQGGLELLPMLVAENAPGWVRSVFEVRTEIGATIAVRAARDASEYHKQRLGTLARQLREAPDADAAQITECEWHRELAAATGNRVYPLLINLVLDTYLRQRHAVRGAFDEPAAAADRLDPLSEAVCSGADAETVRSRATDYLERTGQLMIESMLARGGDE